MAKIKKKPVKFRKKTPAKDVFKAKPTKRDKTAKELPNNSRSITEKTKIKKSINFKQFLFFAVYFLFLVALVVVGTDVYKKSFVYFKLSSQRGEISTEIKGLEDKVRKYPGFKEGYLKMAILEYRIGNFDKSKTYVKQALVLDPNFKDAVDFAKLIGERY